MHQSQQLQVFSTLWQQRARQQRTQQYHNSYTPYTDGAGSGGRSNIGGWYGSMSVPHAHMPHLPPATSLYGTQQGDGNFLQPAPHIWQRSPYTATLTTSAEAQQGSPFTIQYPGALGSNPKEDQRVVTKILAGMGAFKGQDAFVGLLTDTRGQFLWTSDLV